MRFNLKTPPAHIAALPRAGQEIWIAAANAALEEQAGDESRAVAAAWDAVKLNYEQDENGAWRARGDVSLEQIRDLLYAALDTRDKDSYLREVFPGYLIYELGGKYFRLAWAIVDGAVQFGAEASEVAHEWVQVRSGMAEFEDGGEFLMRLGQARDPEGTAWDVTICEPGFTKNGWYIPEEAIRDAAALFEGVDVNLYELPGGATHVPEPLFDLKQLLVKNKVGWIDGVKHAAGVGLQGVLHFLSSATWLGKNLLSAMSEGRAVYGLSYDCPVRASRAVVDGREAIKIDRFIRADSVDIVTRPAAGGKFNRAVAAAPAPHKEDSMKETLWKIISEKRPDLLSGKDMASITEQELTTLARMAMEPPPDKNNGDTEVAVLRCEMALRDKLAIVDLPEIAKERIRLRFAGIVFKTEDLDRAVADEKDYLAKLQPAAPEGEGVPASSIAGGLASYDRACMAVDRMFGLTKEDMQRFSRMARLDHQPFFADIRSAQDYQDYETVPTFRGLREMYQFFTGDAEVSGRFMSRNIPADLRSRMDITSGTFTYLLGNTLGRRMVKDYNEIDYRENILISLRKPVKDFRAQEAVLVGGFPDLDTVDPEAADYQEIAGVTDEESTYTLGQKGNLLTFTRKMIINDDISIVQRLISRLGKVARRTHAKYVWAFFIDNATCSDATALYTGGHGNLGATALSHATALIAYQALAAMTEKDSGERLGLLASPDVKPILVYPIDLMATAETIVNDDVYYASNDLTTQTRNSLKGKIGGYMNPLFSDANDWGLLMPADIIDIVEMGYLNGRQEPELFVADSPQSEQVFVADKIRYKIRHEYAGAAIDYRSGYKAVVT